MGAQAGHGCRPGASRGEGRAPDHRCPRGHLICMAVRVGNAFGCFPGSVRTALNLGEGELKQVR